MASDDYSNPCPNWTYALHWTGMSWSAITLTLEAFSSPSPVLCNPEMILQLQLTSWSEAQSSACSCEQAIPSLCSRINLRLPFKKNSKCSIVQPSANSTQLWWCLEKQGRKDPIRYQVEIFPLSQPYVCKMTMIKSILFKCCRLTSQSLHQI